MASEHKRLSRYDTMSLDESMALQVAQQATDQFLQNPSSEKGFIICRTGENPGRAAHARHLLKQ